MKVIYADGTANNPTTLTFEQFCEAHGLSLVAQERTLDIQRSMKILPWYVYFEGHNIEISDGYTLRSPSGSGETPKEALADLARICQGVTLVRNAMREDRHEFKTPNRWAE